MNKILWIPIVVIIFGGLVWLGIMAYDGYTYRETLSTIVNIPPAPTPPPPVPAVFPPAVQKNSGIEGLVTIGPTCPVQKLPPDRSCDDKPYAAKIQIQEVQDGEVITEFVSDAQGRFKVSLAPGKYLLVPTSGRVYPQASSQEVMVNNGKFTEVLIQYDSGIR